MASTRRRNQPGLLRLALAARLAATLVVNAPPAVPPPPPPCAAVIEMTRGQNLRALYGACACAAQLAGTRRGGSSGGEGEEEVGRLAAQALQQQYAVHCPAKLPLVRGMLKAQGLL